MPPSFERLHVKFTTVTENQALNEVRAGFGRLIFLAVTQDPFLSLSKKTGKHSVVA